MSDSKAHIVNYVWINDTPFTPDINDQDSLLCGVPLHYIDRVITNATRYPDAKFNIWFDFEFLDETSRLFIDSAVYFSRCKNIIIRNLRDIHLYANQDIFATTAAYEHPSGYFGKQPHCIYARADLARVIVLKHLTDLNPYTPVFYCDFDVENISIENERVTSKLDEHGMVFGNTEDDAIENGYMAFIASNLTEDVYFNCGTIQLLLQQTQHAASLNKNGWRPLREIIACRSSSVDEVTVDGLLKPRGYKIPKPAFYDELRIC